MATTADLFFFGRLEQPDFIGNVLVIRGDQLFAIARNIKRKIRSQKVHAGKCVRFSGLEAKNLDLLVSICTRGLKAYVLSVRPPHGPATRPGELTKAAAIRVHDEDATGKTPIGTKTDPLPVWRPTWNRSRSFQDAPSLS